jgi:TonB-dependent SusC/RagA subfamily outer membrane receptor
MTSSSRYAALSTTALLVALGAGCATTKHNPTVSAGRAPTVTADDIEKSGGLPIEEVIQAKSPGVWVSRTNTGGIAVQVRGPSSFSASSEPLYVVDDVPFQPGPGGALTGINPHDIESIRVLKNPADIAVYGVRGSNGVVLVTTKRPNRTARNH